MFSDSCCPWLLLLAGALCAGCGGDGVANYPNRTIVLIVPWAAGGGTDRVARFLAHELERELGKPVVVANKTGGGGASGHSAGAWAIPDGYTITMGTFELSTMSAMGLTTLTYRDFQPLAQVNGDAAAIIVRADARWHSLRALLDDARARPGQTRMSGTAAGGAWDLARAGLLLADKQPASALRWVPSQGSAPALADLLGGHIDSVCCSVPEAAAQLEAGKLRVLGVMAAERLPAFPLVRTAQEEGIAWEAVGWRGLLLPKGTPAELTELLTSKLQKILASDAYREFMKKNGFAIVVRPPDEFERFLAEQETRWSRVIDEADFRSPASPYDPGPWFFPIVLSVGLAAGTLVVVGKILLLRSAALPAVPEKPRDDHPRDWLLVIVALPVYLAAIGVLGFFPSTLVFATLLMRRLGLSWPAAAGLCAVLLAVIIVLFVQVFRVQLPPGIWGRW